MAKTSTFFAALSTSVILLAVSFSLAAFGHSAHGRFDADEIQGFENEVNTMDYERGNNFSSRVVEGCRANQETCEAQSYLVGLILTVQNGSRFICTGSCIKINPLSFLTAGHCFVNLPGGEVIQVQVVFGVVDFTVFNPGGTGTLPPDAKTLTLTPANANFYAKLEDNNDIAVIVANNGVTSPVPIRSLVVASKCDKFGQFKFCGFGLSEKGVGFAFEKGAKCGIQTAIFSPLQCTLLGKDKNAFCGNGLPNTNYCKDSSSACSGDSGGSAIIVNKDGDLEVVGVTIEVIALSLAGNVVFKCVQTTTNVFTSVCANRDWIIKKIPNLDDQELHPKGDANFADKTGCLKNF